MIYQYSATYAAAYNERAVESSSSLRALTTAVAHREDSDPDYFEGTTYYPGPLPVKIVDLNVNGSRATATVCSDGGWTAQSQIDINTRMTQLKFGRLSKWNLVKDDENVVRLDSTSGVYPESSTCSLDGVKYGLFDPQPPYGEYRGT